MTDSLHETQFAKRQLPTLTSLRWYAALAVFLFHARIVTGWSGLDAFGSGQNGVTFFFVLSGFVLTWSHRPDATASTFLRRRFARIYPSHAAVFLVAVVIGLVTGRLFTTPVLGVVLGLVLLQTWAVSANNTYAYSGNAVSWSLSAEAFFYVSFLGALPLLRRLRTGALVIVSGLVLSVGGVATILLSRAGYGTNAAFSFPLVLLPQFVLGITLAILVQRGLQFPVPIVMACCALLVFLVIADRAPYFPFRNYVLLPGISALILAGATADLQGMRGLLTHPVSLWLGEVSFAFYLVHHGTLLVLADTVHWSGAAAASLAFAVSLGLAALVHHLIEIPGQRWLAPRTGRRPEQV